MGIRSTVAQMQPVARLALALALAMARPAPALAEAGGDTALYVEAVGMPEGDGPAAGGSDAAQVRATASGTQPRTGDATGAAHAAVAAAGAGALALAATARLRRPRRVPRHGARRRGGAR